MATTTANLSGVVINEVGTSPTTGQADLNGSGTTDGDDEFIEFYNTSGSDVDISGWQVWSISSGTTQNTSGGNMHTFAPGTTLSAGDYIVVVDLNDTSESLLLSNSVYANPTVNSALYGTPTFMALTDSRIIVLYNPATDEYVQFSGEDADAADQADVDTLFGSSTRIGPIERGLEDNSGNSAQRSPDGEDVWVDDVQTPGTANVCFAAGTLIDTPDGPRAVETLQIGDIVLTAAGGSVPVKWLGRQTVSTRFGPAERLLPVRIAAGALSDGLPRRDLALTKDHALVLDGVLVNAGALVNGDSVQQVPLAEMGDQYVVYHVETEAHDVILAEGAPAETYVDYVARAAFDNHAEYLALYGEDRTIRELPLPRISSARMLPAALKARLGLSDAA